MKYVALLSGGKDSCFNLVHCKSNGHELIAAASLGPSPGKEEMDSYMYQTVGQDAIEYVAKALDVPLYRRVISGQPVEQDAEYGGREAISNPEILGDETEDLFELLKEVKDKHPEVSGVSCGAILSNYQRTRVEHVCCRLDLIALCYLWQRDQDELLEEMIREGVKAVLIKVAGIGLKPVHLGKTLAEMQPELRQLNRLYGAHICGEGGEYETFTLDCPLFKKSLILEEIENVIHSDNDFATVAYLRIKSVTLQDKPSQEWKPINMPIFDKGDCKKVDKPSDLSVQAGYSHSRNCKASVSEEPDVIPSPTIQKMGNWVFVANMHVNIHCRCGSIREEITWCFDKVKDELSQFDLSLTDLAFVNLLLSDMDMFAEVNSVYKTYFGTSPPARACVAARLPEGLRVQMDCLAYAAKDESERRALHVQSLSHWAPANIGPYSQLIAVGSRILISGQIGMVPCDLSLPRGAGICVETRLAVQHANHILDAMKLHHGLLWKPCPLGLIFWAIDLDRHMPELVELKENPIMNTPALLVEPKSLPKGALSEVQPIFHTGLYNEMDEEGETETKAVETFQCHKAWGRNDNAHFYWEASDLEGVVDFCAIVAGCGRTITAEPVSKQMRERFPHRKDSAFVVRLFHKQPLQEYMFAFARELPWIAKGVPISAVPVEYIATRVGEDWDFALFIIG